jgi:predicted phosphodiesterase
MKILVAGDIHGRINFLENLVFQTNADAVFQVGDLGFYPNYDSLDITSKRHFRNDSGQSEIFSFIDGRKKFPVPLFFVRGNHDDYSLLGDEVPPFPHNFFLLSSGIHSVIGLRVASLGGIYYWGHNSEKRRLAKYTQPDEMALITGDETVDVLLCHDSPYCHVFKDTRRYGSPYVSRLTSNLSPSFLFYGHYDVLAEPYIIGSTQVYPMTTVPCSADNSCFVQQQEALFGILHCSKDDSCNFSYLRTPLK